MDTASSKRRKTSPSTSVPNNGQNTQTRPISQDGEQSPSRRASFMSPTKASLARFNPNLLPRSNASEPQRPRSQGSDGERLGTRGVVNGNTQEDTRARLEEPRNTLDRLSAVSANGQGLRATPRRRSRTPGNDHTPVRSTRPLFVPNPRASPPEEAREAQNGLETTNAEGQALLPRQSNTSGQFVVANGASHASQTPNSPSTPLHGGLPRATSGMGFNEDGEPSLPTTPVHFGLEAPPESPKGLLFSSPSRRPKRKKKGTAKSSPLQLVDGALVRPVSTSSAPLPNLGPRLFIAKTPRPPPKAEEAEELRMRENLAGLEKQLQDIENCLIRQTLVSMWHQGESKEMKEHSRLKKVVSMRSTKVIRSREEILQYTAAKSTYQDLASVDSMHQDTAEGIPSADSLHEPSSTFSAQHSLTQRLAHFLPFSNSTPSPKTDPPSVHNPDALQSSSTENMQEERTAPFDINITNASLLPFTSDEILLQRQDLALSSSQQLLQARLQVTMNVTEQAITQLKVLGISHWADRELGRWLRACPQDTDLSAIGRAFRRYSEISRERAECFMESEQEFKVLLPNGKITDRARSSNLVSHLGRQELIFSRNLVALDIVWKISINDDGEVEGNISAKASFPDTWRRIDGGAELGKIGEAFDLLVKDRGALEAIRVVCTLIFPT